MIVVVVAILVALEVSVGYKKVRGYNSKSGKASAWYTVPVQKAMKAARLEVRKAERQSRITKTKPAVERVKSARRSICHIKRRAKMHRNRNLVKKLHGCSSDREMWESTDENHGAN